MAIEGNFRLQGADAVLKRLRNLTQQVERKATRRALGKAAAVIKRRAKENALQIDDPETGRRISDNIVQRVRTKRSKNGQQVVSVGVATEKGKIPKGNPDTGPRGNTPHWHLVELGTEHMIAQPFLRNALEETADQAGNEFVDALNNELDKLTL